MEGRWEMLDATFVLLTLQEKYWESGSLASSLFMYIPSETHKVCVTTIMLTWAHEISPGFRPV